MWQDLAPRDDNRCIGGSRTRLAPEFAASDATQRGLFEGADGAWRIPIGLDPGPYETRRISDRVWDGTTRVIPDEGEPPVLLRRRVTISTAQKTGDDTREIRIEMELRNIDAVLTSWELGLWAIGQVPQDSTARVRIPISATDCKVEAPWELREGSLEPGGSVVYCDRASDERWISLRPPRDRRFKIGVGPVPADGRVRYERAVTGGLRLAVEHLPLPPGVSEATETDGRSPRDLDYGDIVQLFNSSRDEDGASFTEIETRWPGNALAPGAGFKGVLILRVSVDRLVL